MASIKKLNCCKSETNKPEVRRQKRSSGFGPPGEDQADVVQMAPLGDSYPGAPQDKVMGGQFNYNFFANKKNVAQGMMDVALLMANASQLKYVLEIGPKYHYYYLMVTLLGISIGIQLLVGIALLILARVNLVKPQELTAYERMDEEHSRMMQQQVRLNDYDDVAFACDSTPRTRKKHNKARQQKMKMLKTTGTSTDNDNVIDYFRQSPHNHVNVIREHKKAEFLNDFVTGCIFVLLVVNTFISAFGLTERYVPFKDVGVQSSSNGYPNNTVSVSAGSK